MSIRVLLVDDHSVVRDGIRALLSNTESEFDVVGDAGTPEDAIRLAESATPDVAIVDAELGGFSGAHLTRLLLEDHDRLRVVALSMHGDISTVHDMLDAGATGYVLKRSGGEALRCAVLRANDGLTFIDDDVVDMLVPVQKRDLREDRTTGLTLREREILSLLADGYATKAIAYELAIGRKTVETHRRNLTRKLGTSNLADLTKIAIRQKLSKL